MTDFDKYLNFNKDAWNKRTPVHINSKFYNHEEFKYGKTSLNAIELNAIGDVKNKKILHLQCHFGQDSISLARMGAIVTAVDFSNIAIDTAKKIALEDEQVVEFIESDVLNLNLSKEYDLVFSSYGAIGWLPDLNKWGAAISRHLKKGGEFLLTEFHPFLNLITEPNQNYFYDINPQIEINNTSYTDGKIAEKTKTCWWNHSLTEIFIALESNGLKLLHFEEFDYSPYKLEGMIEKSKEKFVLKDKLNNRLPYTYNLKAIKK